MTIRIAVPLLFFTALVSGCGESPDRRPNDSASVAIAHYRGGSVTFAEATSRLARDRKSGNVRPECRERGLGATVSCYRAIAQDIAFESILTKGSDLPVELDDSEMLLFEDLLVRKYLAEQLEAEEIPDDQIQSHYEENRDSFTSPASIVLWNIFIRHDEASRQEATLERLRSIRERYAAGETFAALAREHSQSETRFRNGYIGSVRRGELSPHLESTAFSLEAGEVSQPLLVPGGGVLLYVSDVSPRIERPLTAVSGIIRANLMRLKHRDIVEEKADDIALPNGGIQLDEQEFKARLDTGERDQIVLKVGTTELTAREFLGSNNLPEKNEENYAEALDAYWKHYQQSLALAKLRYWLRTGEHPLPTRLRDDARSEFDSLRRSRNADEWLSAEVKKSARKAPDRLGQFYQDRNAQYMTPFLLDLVVLQVPATSVAPVRLERLERFSRALPSLEAWQRLAVDMNGDVKELGELEFEALEEHLPGKAPTILSQAESKSTVGPFIADDELYLLWIRERVEPVQRSFDDAFDDVLTDYVTRFAEPLAQEISARLLSEHDFSFNAEALRQTLGMPQS